MHRGGETRRELGGGGHQALASHSRAARWASRMPRRRSTSTPQIAPWACLHHFTLPRWFAERGGFLVEANWTEHWTRHVDFVADPDGPLIMYSYTVAGVQYSASQNVLALQSLVPGDAAALLGPTGVKFDPRNPANSIVVCEQWSGLQRVKGPR